MKLILFVVSFLLIPVAFAQKVSYPPAPASVYKPYHQNKPVSHQLKNTLWSNDVSDTIEWSFSNSSVPVNDWFIAADESVISTSGPFQAATASNGFLAFISDTLSGAISDAYVEFVGAQIDLTGEANIRMQFDHQFISDSNERLVEVSPDGITWIPFVISDGLTPTGEKMDDLVSINITSVAGNANDLHFRFHFSGSQEGYWAIDDIELRSIDSVDLRAVSLDWGTTGAWGVRMPYYSIWSTQAQPIEFCAVVENIGLSDIDSFVYNVGISNIWTPSVSYNFSDTFSILAGEKESLCSVNTYTPNWSDGYYYSLSQEVSCLQDETNCVNNQFMDETFSLGFSWSQYYGRDTYITSATGEIDASQLCEYEVGNVFDFFQTRWPYSMRIGISSNATTGNEIYGSLYKFDTIVNDFVQIGLTYTHIVTSSDIGFTVDLGFIWVGEPCQAGNTYLVTAHSYGGLCGGTTAFGVSGESKPNTSFFIDLSSGTPAFSYLTETPIVGLVTPPEINWGLEETNGTIPIEIYPNPAAQEVTLDFHLTISSIISIDLFDLSGKPVQKLLPKQCFEGRNEIQLVTEDLRNGVYFVKLTTDFGSSTKRIIIQH